ncbi:hypothetical protein BCR33DRAFT_788827 [Rhizoclosmatium globosum]|uniref:Uncharacterized protein n=1 Tax=Rhizoclosmatium globosum TaxID=329046 RepID=A0A1Y2BVE2_9FUNG|nr:hypothetical protein BCR33DRAFT_788827 [Rhizoclosmatium globosum]|eukprot:ORY38597.1 hypothetical protein BCR33DRAFT_788827 [Rhizoclosmatium globosum]
MKKATFVQTPDNVFDFAARTQIQSENNENPHFPFPNYATKEYVLFLRKIIQAGNDLLVLLARLGHKNLPKTVDKGLSYLQTDERVAVIGKFQTLSLGDYEGKQITLYYRSLINCFLEHMLEGGMEDMKFTGGLLKTEETGERVYGENTSGDAFNAALKSALPGAKVVKLL